MGVEEWRLENAKLLPPEALKTEDGDVFLSHIIENHIFTTSIVGFPFLFARHGIYSRKYFTWIFHHAHLVNSFCLIIFLVSLFFSVLSIFPSPSSPVTALPPLSPVVVVGRLGLRPGWGYYGRNCRQSLYRFRSARE